MYVGELRRVAEVCATARVGVYAIDRNQAQVITCRDGAELQQSEFNKHRVFTLRAKEQHKTTSHENSLLQEQHKRKQQKRTSHQHLLATYQ
jgi:hypothetical protein